CHSLAGARCLASEDRKEVAPPGVLKALIEPGLAAGSIVQRAAVAVRIRLRRGTAAQIRGLNRLDVEHIVEHIIRAHQGERRLVVEVAPLPAHVLLLLGALLGSLRMSLTSLLATADALVGLLQRLLRCAVAARVGDGFPRGGEKEDREAHSDA